MNEVGFCARSLPVRAALDTRAPGDCAARALSIDSARAQSHNK